MRSPDRQPGATGLEAVVFDLDGVIRHWNDDELDRHAAGYGLPARAVLDIAFSEDLGPAAVTGRMTFEAWMAEVRSRVLAAYGEAAHPVLEVWESNIGSVDPQMLELVRRLRRQVTVAVLSNGTTRLRSDLEMLDLAHEFDVVFNTAEMGVAKPDREAYEHVLEELGTEPGRTAFIDDREDNVAGAESVGMPAHHFRGAPGAVAFLGSLGLPARSPS